MSNKSTSKNRYIRRKWDMSLLVTVIFLVCFGLIMVYSTSSYESAMKFNDSAYYLKKQLFATAIGVAAMIFVASIDYHVWKKFAIIAYILTIICIVLVLTPLGIEANGARRWIGVGSLSFQPAELAKLAIIVFFAYFLSKKPKLVNKFSTSLAMLFYAGLIALMIMVITSNLSSAIIIGGIAYVMMIVTSKKSKWYIIVAVVLFAAAVAVLMATGGYRLERIRVWLEPEAYAKEGGFQTLQALYALGSGGLFGKGLGQSVQKLGFVPEAQNDMVFSIICEELGIFGGVAIIILFGFMIWRFMVIANNAEDLFGTLLVVGIMSHIALQVVLNIAVVTNTIPNTGITLPFISYGGTSTVFIMAEMGLALSVSKGKKIKRQVITDEEET
ncbi:MAG: putative lipid II flippase FtsW [Lachnospiraceae bacterium]|nr:putative lipid II flippase FtsW [Lachnospiraceae bacterium]